MLKKICLICVFLIVFIFHVLSLNMTPSDSRWSIHIAMSIIKKGDINLDEYADLIKNESRGIIYENGHFYSYRSIGPSLVALPFVYSIDKTSQILLNIFPNFKNYLKKQLKQYIEKKYTTEFPRFQKYFKRYVGIKCSSLNCMIDNMPINIITFHPFIQLIIASCIVAITTVFIYLISCMFLDTRRSLLISFIFAFCTSAWSTASRALWEHGPSMLMLTIVLYVILLARTNPRLIQFISIPLAFSFIIRPTNAIAIFFFTLFVFIKYRRFFIFYVFWSITVLFPIFLYYLYNFGSILPPYYQLQGKILTTPNFFESLTGTLISPARGIFVYSPVFLFFIWGIILKIKNKEFDNLDFSLLSIIFMHWIIISSRYDWFGGWSIGPRYFCDTTPYFIYFIIYFVRQKISVTKIGNKLTIFLFMSSIIASFLINFNGATNIRAWLWNEKAKLWDWKNPQFLQGFD